MNTPYCATEAFYRRAKLWDRIEENYTPEPNSGCWIWIASVSGPRSHQYPAICVNGKKQKAHRLSYELMRGPIPSGLFACHTCHNTYCVNPDHLYAGTRQQNTDDMMRAGRHFSQANPKALAALRQRALSYSKLKRAATLCKHGHPLSGENLYVSPTTGMRGCVTCRKAHKQAFRERQRNLKQQGARP